MKRPATVISYLSMNHAPSKPAPEMNVLKAQPFPLWYFRALYQAVGSGYFWTDMLELSEEELAQYCDNPKNTLYSLISQGAPAGMFVLYENEEITNLAYFGLTKESHGQGLGGQLLDYAIATAWQRPEIKEMTVNTCTLDHERALPLYLSRGFVVTHEEAQEARL